MTSPWVWVSKYLIGRVCIWSNISSRIFRSTLWLTTAIIRAWMKLAMTARPNRADIHRMAFSSGPKSREPLASIGVMYWSITSPRKVAARAVATAFSRIQASTTSSRGQ